MAGTLAELDFYATEVKTAPAVEVLTVEDAKAFARIDTSDEDNLIGTMVVASRERVEEEIRRPLINTVYTLKLPRFPVQGARLFLNALFEADCVVETGQPDFDLYWIGDFQILTQSLPVEGI